jgi:spore maturation protein CgeB
MKRLWRSLESHAIEIVIVCHDLLWPAEVAELKKRTRALVVMWFPDHLGTIGRGLFMNAKYDALFFKDPYIVHRLGHVLRSPCFYLPECFNPEKHWLPKDALDENPVYKCDIGTAGNSHAYRIAFLQNLDGYDVKQWGNYPPLWLPTGAVAGMHQGRQALEHEKVRAFRGAKIVINNLHYGEVWGVNVRTFEAAGAGAFQMVDWRPGLQQLFDDGRELISFRTMRELKENIDYWLPREGERRTIGEAAMKRAHADHTYRHRLELLLATLIDEEHGFPLPDIHNCA